MLKRRPTIKDVAKAAGVTYPTVSRVLSDKPYVAPNTRARVMEAIAQLDYRPSQVARSMVSQRTHALALLVPNLTDPNFGTFFAGAEREARKHGYTVLVADHESVQLDDRLLREQRVDGLLIAEAHKLATLLEGAELPVVSLDDVGPNQRAGGQMVGKHLRQLGHQRVAFIGGPASSPHALERVTGWRDVFPKSPWFDGDWTVQSGFELLPAALKAKVSAVFAANDHVALGVLSAAHQLGLQVPHDLSVIGFDDVVLAEHFWPPLTTVRQSLELQGSLAARLLIMRLEQPAQAKHHPEPASLELIVRHSTAPPLDAFSRSKFRSGKTRRLD